jgi:hypothetical protein
MMIVFATVVNDQRILTEKKVLQFTQDGNVCLCFRAEDEKWVVARWCGDAWVDEVRRKTRKPALREYEIWVSKVKELNL